MLPPVVMHACFMFSCEMDALVEMVSLFITGFVAHGAGECSFIVRSERLACSEVTSKYLVYSH